ncbi:unnamed protein product [Polarella glacialis]|uniref:Uncharacterized protein n=1 Tax=Polarella glacialis TaxID=89957 RepID=A0A813H0P1_POLGL|nr:unnamed protein product [Polarella glacialis]
MAELHTSQFRASLVVSIRELFGARRNHYLTLFALNGCRDGSMENFEGMPEPLCVTICDRRIFDECDSKEACIVNEEKPNCIDPCEDKQCGRGEVCEVAPRDEAYNGKVMPGRRCLAASCVSASGTREPSPAK